MVDNCGKGKLFFLIGLYLQGEFGVVADVRINICMQI
jgi:hypothetical protein